ncbi:UNVERIFIED_CONTAM: hypothetical protein PYX00_002193 [Menopon gallinae]|uniref:Myeloid differentiation primary response protein MyD88 n=1 Tax=Menopon gallinae TaxID=328185 RepID=A0AAW2IH02_9NEOP
MAKIDHDLDLSEIPLSALKQSTLVTLSASLNHYKIIPTNNGLPRDWRGLAQLMGFNGVETHQISVKPDCFLTLINQWGEKGNVALLQEYLSLIDRYDVLDDTQEAIVRDGLEYKDRLNKINTSTKNICIDADKEILTVDDVGRLEKGLGPQIYDAYVLYAEEDADFASEIIKIMENKYNFKLCVRDRDLIGGVQFEHDAITKLIAERCRRLVVVVSSNFLKSKANKFFVTFAQALGIDIRERKVIPILYEHCEIPPELSYYFLLDYNRAGKLWNFWDKLRDSIQAPDVGQSHSAAVPTSVRPKNHLWISRTHFEEQKESEEAAPKEKHSQIPAAEIKTKKGNIYKMIKNGFNKVKKKAGGQETTDKTVPNEEVPYENFDHSSSFEKEHEESEPSEKGRKAKKKWYKKKPVETLLS